MDTDDGLTGTLDIAHAAEGRHPGVRSLARHLTPNPRLEGTPAQIAQFCERLGSRMIGMVPQDNAELSAGLRKLLEAKDCFIRAALEAGEGTPG